MTERLEFNVPLQTCITCQFGDESFEGQSMNNGCDNQAQNNPEKMRKTQKP